MKGCVFFEKNQAKGGYPQVEFRLGEIENLPVADASADVIISNCVINDGVRSHQCLGDGGRARGADDNLNLQRSTARFFAHQARTVPAFNAFVLSPQVAVGRQFFNVAFDYGRALLSPSISS